MKLVRYGAIAAFYERVEAFLLEREAEHNLLLGISATLQHQPGYYTSPPYLAAVEQNGEVALVVMRTPPHSPVLSLAAPDCAADQALDLLAGDLRAVYGAQVNGVNGPSALSLGFAERWREATGRAYRVSVRERIYRLDAVTPVAGVAGTMRAATEADRSLLERWVVEFQDEALPPTEFRMPPERWVTLQLTPPMRNIVLWVDAEGLPVTMVGVRHSTPHGATIGPVYTPPEQRRRGYASACVAAVSQQLLDEGRQFCFLYTNLDNPTSNHIYQTIGYRPVSDATVYDFEAAVASGGADSENNGDTRDASA